MAECKHLVRQVASSGAGRTKCECGQEFVFIRSPGCGRYRKIEDVSDEDILFISDNKPMERELGLHRKSSEMDEAAQCPECGYTDADARLHMDHHRCKNFTKDD